MKIDEKARRKKENEELLERMKEGHNLCHTALGAYRWAPRPLTLKSKKDIEALYGKTEGK